MTDFEELMMELERAVRYYQSYAHTGKLIAGQGDPIERRRAARKSLLDAIQEATHPTTAYEVVEGDDPYYHRAMWLDKAGAEGMVATGELEYYSEWDDGAELTIKERPISYPEEADQ